MTMVDDPAPDPSLRREWQQLPDAPFPDGLWQRLNDARGHRLQRRRIGLAAATMAIVAVVSLPWLLPPDGTTTPAPPAVASAALEAQAPRADVASQLRACLRISRIFRMDSRSVAILAPLGGWTDGWTPQRRYTPRLLPQRRQDGLFTITDLGVHDPDLAVHDADPSVHDAPMLLFTMVRSGCSRRSETRSGGVKANSHVLFGRIRAHD